MADINQSASASAEANIAKFTGNTVNFNQAPSSIVSGPNGIAKLVRAVAPVWYEKREAEALSVRTDSLIETAKRIKEQFPVMSERRAVMEALGYRMTNEQADNVFSVMSQAQDNLSGDERISGAVSPEARDYIVEGSKAAYEEDVRSLWARLTAGEMEQPGTYSKRSMSILSDMSREEALVFSKLCSTSIFVNPRGNRTLTAVLREDKSKGTYNNGLLSVEDLDVLSSLGLITTMTWRTLHLEGNQLGLIEVDGRLVPMKNPSNEKKSIAFSQIRFLREGLILSTLCEVGSFEYLPQIVNEVISASGLVSHL